MLSLLLKRSTLSVHTLALRLPTRTFVSSARLLAARTTTASKTAKPSKLKPKSKSKSDPKPKKAPVKTEKPVVQRVSRGSRISKELLPPKRPKSPFFYFLADRFPEKSTSLDQARERAIAAGKAWTALSADEKAAYTEDSAAAQPVYNEAIGAWLKDADPALIREVRRRRLVSSPRLRLWTEPRYSSPVPPNAFNRYMRHRAKTLDKNDIPEGTKYVVHLSQVSASDWRAMSDEEKAPYVEPYLRELEAWKTARGKAAAQETA